MSLLRSHAADRINQSDIDAMPAGDPRRDVKRGADSLALWEPNILDAPADSSASLSLLSAGAPAPRTWQPPQVEPGAAAARLALDARRRRKSHGGYTAIDDDAAAEIRHAAFQQGVEEGLRRGKNEIRQSSARLAEITRALEAARNVFLKDLEANATALALAAARHLAGRELTADPRLVSELIARGLHLVKGDAPITIRVNPADLDSLREPLEGNVSMETGTLRWVSDPEIAPGGFVIETPKRIVNGRIDEALRNLYERLVYE